MRIFITGARGKLGKHITKYLLKKKYYCYLNTRKKIESFKSKKVKILKCDILSNKFKIPDDVKIIIHLAASTPSNSKQNLKENHIIDNKIYRYIKKSKNISKLIFLSTVKIYSEKNLKSVSEKEGEFDKSIYSMQKISSEKFFLSLKKKVYNVRVPGIIGTKNDNNFLSNLIKNIYKNKSFKVYNQDQKFNNVLHIDDLNEFIHNLIVNNYNSGNILLGAKEPIKLKKIVEIIEKFFKVKNHISWTNEKNGFYLNIRNAVTNYNFKAKRVVTILNKYLKQKDINKTMGVN